MCVCVYVHTNTCVYVCACVIRIFFKVSNRVFLCGTFSGDNIFTEFLAAKNTPSCAQCTNQYTQYYINPYYISHNITYNLIKHHAYTYTSIQNRISCEDNA